MPHQPYGLSSSESVAITGGLRSTLLNAGASSHRSSALSAIWREAECLGSDVDALLGLIAARARTLVRGSGAAIALATSESRAMVCQASVGVNAPPIGSRLHVGSGFSGECVRTRKVLRCDDTETDTRVDRERCRVLNIRSMIVAPVRQGENVIGVIEVFSCKSGAFHDNDSTILQRLAEIIIASLNPAPHAQSQDATAVAAAMPDSPPRLNPKDKNLNRAESSRSIGLLLTVAATTIVLAFGYTMASSLQQRVHVGQRKNPGALPSFRSPIRPARPASSLVSLTNNASSLEQLRQLAEHGDPPAQYALGVLYAFGDGVSQSYSEAVRWFSRAAYQGHVTSQTTLGAYYMVGRGVTVDLSKAYFWSYLASIGGDKESKLRVEKLSSKIPHSEMASLQEQARKWTDAHSVDDTPSPGH
jgi:TPR repeat protein